MMGSPGSSLADSPAPRATAASPLAPAKGEDQQKAAEADAFDEKVKANVATERKVRQFEHEVEALSLLLEAQDERSLSERAESLFGSRTISAAMSDSVASSSSRQAIRYHATSQGLKLSQGCAAALELIEASRRILKEKGEAIQLRASLRATEQLVRIREGFMLLRSNVSATTRMSTSYSLQRTRRSKRQHALLYDTPCCVFACFCPSA